MNTFTLGACFQHELHTGPYFMTFAPRLSLAYPIAWQNFEGIIRRLTRVKKQNILKCKHYVSENVRCRLRLGSELSRFEVQRVLPYTNATTQHKVHKFCFYCSLRSFSKTLFTLIV